MLAWILEDAGLNPGYLIGGVPNNFGESARIGADPFFVIEADEYDTAFFDKRSKFVHYRPRTLVLNNLEFDHADIFDDLGMIQRQFHHLVRTVPGNGLIVAPAGDRNLEAALKMGCWTGIERFDGPHGWHGMPARPDCSCFEVYLRDAGHGQVDWPLTGLHNMSNALAAIAAARHAGVPPAIAVEALCRFTGIKRRMELKGEVDGIQVLDDFAHHPTAIATTLAGLRASLDGGRIVAILDPRSNTMRMGVHGERLATALYEADQVIVHAPQELSWQPASLFQGFLRPCYFEESVEAIVTRVTAIAQPGDRLLVMSNGGFGGIHQRLLDALEQRHAAP
jgi:UDP-N-acetylmuramate: L-alanyl-gamma-D-glutamyl-meso-diaminopimelate ligase